MPSQEPSVVAKTVCYMTTLPSILYEFNKGIIFCH
jgi:hypothetical protein